MSTLGKFDEKIRKYLSKLTNLKIKEKLINLTQKIGISQEEFSLIDDNLKEIVFPCEIGVIFCGEPKDLLFEFIQKELDTMFDSFFYDIKNLGEYNFSEELLSKGSKVEYKANKEYSEKISVHPTNKFYQMLIDKRNQEKVDIIVCITNLPLYSSENNNIIFLFGESNLLHRCSVVSSLKLKEQFYSRKDNEPLFVNRIVKEVLHEIGHIMLGVTTHCANTNCAMRFSKEVKEIDLKNPTLCKECQQKLIKKRALYNF